MNDTRSVDPVAEVERLAGWREPFLIGIRHHSPVIAAAVPALLEAAAPELVLVELPEELQGWIEWLGADELVAPVALAAARRDGQGLVFYPYADFSPELAAVRWARAQGVRVRAFDLPVGMTTGDDGRARTRLAPESPISEALGRAVGATDADELWDRAVEARAPGAEPEAIRRAALAVGWSLRWERSTFASVPPGDLQRETWMRMRLREAVAAGARRCVAVVGAFHVSAFLEPHGATPRRQRTRRAEVITSLVPYTFELLDARTGYPAGIRDPEWQQGIWQGGATADAAARTVTASALRVCRELRRRGHPAGVPDAREAIRLSLDLARLRGLPAPGRRELVEALQSALAQGEPLGRGRAVAAAMHVALIGSRRGRLAPGTPRSGLVPHVEDLLRDLRLPGPNDTDPREVRLDPLRSELDRRRHIALQRLLTCEVPYAHAISVDVDRLTGRWVLRWAPATSASLEIVSQRGVTLAQAAEGTLRLALFQANAGEGPTARLRLETLHAAAECGLAGLVEEQLAELERALPAQASLTELVRALELCDRLERGHVPGFAPTPDVRRRLTEAVEPALAEAALVAIEGLAGSNSVEDARALLAVVQHGNADRLDGVSRLRWALGNLERDGSSLMQGASGAVRVLLGHLDPLVFGERMGSWVDASVSDQAALARRLTGALIMAAPLLEAAPEITRHLIDRIGALPDADFLRRLPALREGFDVLSPAARQRLFHALRPTLSERFDPRLDQPREVLARWAAADLAGRQAVATQLPEVLEWTNT